MSYRYFSLCRAPFSLRPSRLINRSLVLFYVLAFIFLSQMTISIFYSCARGEFICARFEANAIEDAIYSDFNPRLYKTVDESGPDSVFFAGSDVKLQSLNKTSDKNSIVSIRGGTYSRTDSGSVVEHALSKAGKERTLKISTKSNNTAPCPFLPPYLIGQVPVNKDVLYSFEEIEKKYSYLSEGGIYSPPDCIPSQKVAIILPYRDRKEHLSFFLNHMHYFLKRQQIFYQIFVIEIQPLNKFNKGLIFNAGFVEALRMLDFDCFVFHDVDLLPENDRNLYRCWSHSPKHLSVAVSTFQYRLPTYWLIGGVNAMTKDQFILVNGYSNKFYGWGGEDDDLYNRITASQMTLSRITEDVARYTMLTHKKRTPNPTRWDLLEVGLKRWKHEGLNSLKYTVLNREKLKLCTYILIDFDIKDPSFSEEIYTKSEKSKLFSVGMGIFAFLLFVIFFSFILTIFRRRYLINVK